MEPSKGALQIISDKLDELEREIMRGAGIVNRAEGMTGLVGPAESPAEIGPCEDGLIPAICARLDKIIEDVQRLTKRSSLLCDRLIGSELPPAPATAYDPYANAYAPARAPRR